LKTHGETARLVMCHESGNPRTAPCVAFLRYKRARERLPIARAIEESGET
jgi:hypothetical protein